MTTAWTKLKEKLVKYLDKDTGYSKKVLVKKFRLPNGLVETYFIDQDKDSVQVFPVTSDGRVITVTQFRAGTESDCLELPGGGLEDGEEPHLGATRELLEEVGYSGRMVHLASVPYSPYSNGKRHMFMATDCERKQGQDLDPNEFVKIKFWDMTSFRDLMKQGKVRGYENAYLALDRLGRLESKS